MMNPFRILIIGYQLNAEDMDDIAQCGIPVELSHYDLREILAAMHRSDATSRALEVVRNISPDLLIYNIGVLYLQRGLDFDFFDHVRKLGAKICCIIGDTWPNLNSCELLGMLKSDYYLMWDKYTVCNKYSRIIRQLGLTTKILYWPTPNHIIKHYPNWQEVDKKYDVTFLGRTPTPWRQNLVTYMSTAMPQFGFNFSHLNPSNDLTNSEYARLTMESKISINCQTSFGNVFQIKGRIAELVASSAMPLIEENPETRKLIPPDCAVYYDGFEDCANKAAYFLRNNEERENIANNGAKWYESNFDAKDLWRRIIIGCQCNG